MPKAQPTFDASQYLNGDDCDIMAAYSGVVDSAYDLRRQFNSILVQGRQLKAELFAKEAELLAKEAEISDLKAQHQQELSRLQKFSEITRDKLRTQLRQSKGTNQLLRVRNRGLTNDLEAEREKLDKVDHLRCDICANSFKNSMLICGHGYCKECITEWLRQNRADHPEDDPENTCPLCRRIFKKSDIRKLFLESDNRTFAVLEGSDGQREIQLVDSDSE